MKVSLLGVLEIALNSQVGANKLVLIDKVAIDRRFTQNRQITLVRHRTDAVRTVGIVNGDCAVRIIDTDTVALFAADQGDLSTINSVKRYRTATYSTEGISVCRCRQRLDVLKEALQKPPLPSRMEQKCSVRLFLTTPECAVFFANTIVKC